MRQRLSWKIKKPLHAGHLITEDLSFRSLVPEVKKFANQTEKRKRHPIERKIVRLNASGNPGILIF